MQIDFNAAFDRDHGILYNLWSVCIGSFVYIDTVAIK